MAVDETPASIVILGAGAAGLSTFHSLLKPHLLSAQASGLPVPKCILVSSSRESYWHIASPRAMVCDTGVEEEKMFLKIDEGLEQYKGSGLAEFVCARVVEVSPEEKVVKIVRIGEAGEEAPEESLEFGELVVALGASQAEGLPFKKYGAEGEEVAKKQLAEWREKIAAVENIVVAGGGATGVETASEIKNKYPGKKVTIITADPTVLGLRKDVDAVALSLLQGQGIAVIPSTFVKSQTTLPSGSIELTLSSASDSSISTLTTDLFIPAWGATPNTSSLPKSLLDPKGWFLVNEYLQSPSSPHIWALGDILPYPAARSVVCIGDQVPVLIHNISLALNLPPSSSCFGFGKGVAEMKTYKPKDVPAICLVPIAKGGTGKLFALRVWGWFVGMVKKNYLIEKHVDLIHGRGEWLKK